jgi:hypothetical protein
VQAGHEDVIMADGRRKRLASMVLVDRALSK